MNASTNARPASTTIDTIRRSCSDNGSLASISTTATSHRSSAAAVRRDAKYSAPGLADPAADAGGVDEPPGPPAECHQLVDGIDGGAGDRVDEHPICACDSVEQAGLADIGLAEQCDSARTTLGGVEHLGRCVGQGCQHCVEQVTTPRPCKAETACGSPRPRFHSAAASASPERLSTLFAASTTGLPARRSTRTTPSSASVAPTVASTTNTTTSAAAAAISACAVIRAAMPSASGSQPPVSTSVNLRPDQAAS